VESHHDLISLFEHDLFGKPVSTFPDHAPGKRQRGACDFANTPSLTLQTIDKLMRFSQLKIAQAMYTMAHCLLQKEQEFRRFGVQSVMANPPSRFRVQAPPRPQLPSERCLLKRGGA
jgi:hypothetical protein